jgi:hypothetical protein
MLVIKRPRSFEEVEQFDTELSGSRCTAVDGETRRAIGAALSEEALCPTMLGARRWGDEEADEVSERQTEVDMQLDGVFAARIALRFLTNHYLAAKVLYLLVTRLYQGTNYTMPVPCVYLYLLWIHSLWLCFLPDSPLPRRQGASSLTLTLSLSLSLSLILILSLTLSLTLTLTLKEPPREGWTGSVQHECSPAERCEP